MQKTFIGPHLRRLRLELGETQGAMAKALNISPSYVNLLENNERSVSVQVLFRNVAPINPIGIKQAEQNLDRD